MTSNSRHKDPVFTESPAPMSKRTSAKQVFTSPLETGNQSQTRDYITRAYGKRNRTETRHGVDFDKTEVLAASEKSSK